MKTKNLITKPLLSDTSFLSGLLLVDNLIYQVMGSLPFGRKNGGPFIQLIPQFIQPERA